MGYKVCLNILGLDEERREKFIFTVPLLCPVKASATCGDREGASAQNRCPVDFTFVPSGLFDLQINWNNDNFLNKPSWSYWGPCTEVTLFILAHLLGIAGRVSRIKFCSPPPHHHQRLHPPLSPAGELGASRDHGDL